MEFPNPFGLPELVEKAQAQYGPRELALLRRMYPELGDKTPEAVAKMFDVNGKLLSLSSVAGLREIFSDLSASQLSHLLKDDKASMEAIDGLKRANKAERRRVWLTLSSLPLSAQVRKHLEDAFRDRTRPDSEPPPPESGENAEIVWVPSPAHLPYGNLPELETLLDASRKLKSAELPNADVYVVQDGALVRSVKLSNQETVAALQYVQGRLEYIKEERSALEDKYRKAQGLPAKSPVDAQDVKFYWLRRLTQKRLAEILEPKIGHVPTGATLEIRFAQYRREMPAEVRKRVASSASLRGFYAERIGGAVLSVPAGSIGQPQVAEGVEPMEAKPLEMAKTVELSVIDSYLGIDTFVLEEPEAPVKEKRRFVSYKSSEGRDVEQLNEFQKDYLAIQRATKSGQWDRVVELYLKNLEYWPHYIGHRIGALDLHAKYQAGLIPRLPRKILSLASGPHGELRAQWEVSKIFPDARIPQVTQLDATAKMLQRSAESLPPGAAQHAIDVVGDMREVKVEGDDYDVVECSSFDNLKDQEDIKRMLTKAAGKLAIGGVFRFMVDNPVSDGSCQTLEANGFTVLDKNKSITLSSKVAERIRQEKGQIVLDRIRYKLKHQLYFTARKDAPTDQDALRAALEGVPFYGEKTKRATSLSAVKDLRRAISGDEQKREIDVATHLLVAMNAPFFLAKRGLKPEELEFSLRAIKGEVDTASAIKLAQAFFTNQLLAPYAHLVFDVVKDVPEVVGNLSVLLLEHANVELVKSVEPLMVARPATYLIPVLESGLSQETKTRVVKRMLESPQSLAKLEAYLQNHSGQDLIDLVFPLLSKGAKLSLPLAWRFDDRLAGVYQTFAIGAGKGERLSAKEIEQLAQMEEVPEEMRPFAFDYIVEKGKKDKDPGALLDLAQEAAAYAQKDGAWLETHRKSVEKLIATLEKLADEFNLDSGEIEEAKLLKRQILGQAADVSRFETAQVLIEHEKTAREMVAKTLDRYLRRRGLADEYELKQDLWGVTERLAMESGLAPDVAANLLASAARDFNKNTDKAVFLKGFAAGKFEIWSKTPKEKFWLERFSGGYTDGFPYLAKTEPDLARKAFEQASPSLRHSLAAKGTVAVIDLFGSELFDKFPELLNESWFVGRAVDIAPDMVYQHKDKLEPALILRLAQALPERITDKEFFAALARSDEWHAYSRINQDVIRMAMERDLARALDTMPDDGQFFAEALSGKMDKILDAFPDFFATRPRACRPALIAEGLSSRFTAVISQAKHLPLRELRAAIDLCVDKLSDQQLSSLLAARPDVYDGRLGTRLGDRNSDELKSQIDVLQSEKQKIEDFAHGPRDASQIAEIDRILSRQPNLLTVDLVAAFSDFDADTAVKWSRMLPLNDLRTVVLSMWDKVPQIRGLLQERPALLDSFDLLVDLLAVDPPMAGDLLKKKFSYYGNVPSLVARGMEKWLASHSAQEIVDALEGLDQTGEYAMAYFDGLANKDIKMAISYARRHPEFETRLAQKHAVAVLLADPEYVNSKKAIVVNEASAREVAMVDFSTAKRLLDRLQPEEVLRVLGAAVLKGDEDVAAEIWRDYPEVRGNSAVLGSYIQRHPFFLIGHRNDVPEDVRQDVRKRLQANFARRLLATYDAALLQKFDTTGLNNFRIAYALEQSDRSGKYVGYKVDLEGGTEVFVPGSLTHGLDRHDFDPQHVRLRLVPNSRQDRVVGELISPSSATARANNPERTNRVPEVKVQPAVVDVRQQSLKRLVTRFDQRELASLESQGLNHFSVKNLREQTRRQDGRMVGYMVSTDFGVEVFVPMSNVRVGQGDLRQTDRLEMRLQMSHSGDRIVGIIEPSNPFRANR